MSRLTTPLTTAIAVSLGTTGEGAGGASPEFDPASLFGAGDFGGVFDIARMDLCYQDLAGTVPVTALGQTVLSIRSYSNPAFLIKYNAGYSPTPLVYGEDSQGYPCLLDANTTQEWTVYGVEDAGVGTAGDVLAYSVVQTAFGVYSSGNATLGAGSTVIGIGEYTYGAVYATEIAPGDIEVTSTVNTNTTSNTSVYDGPSLDGVPFVYATRVEDGLQVTQVDLEPEDAYNDPQPPFVAPVGMRFWTGAEGGWYGGVIISRFLSNAETLQTQNWCAALAGKTL